MLHGVIEHVEKELRKLIGIASQRRQRLCTLDVERHAGSLCLYLERGDSALEQARGHDIFARHRLPARFEAGDLKQPLDHPHKPPGLAVDDLGDVRYRVAARLALDDRLREPLDRGEGRAELVRDVGEERLLAPARALDLACHLVERRAHLRDLAGSGERDPRAVVAARESPHAADEIAQRARDRPREQRRNKDGERERDETAEGE